MLFFAVFDILSNIPSKMQQMVWIFTLCQRPAVMLIIIACHIAQRISVKIAQSIHERHDRHDMMMTWHNMTTGNHGQNQETSKPIP